MRPSSKAGFMMVETLAAAALAAIVGSGLVAALASADARGAEARMRAAALRQAEFLIDEARRANPSQMLQTEGTIPSPALRWTRTIGPLGGSQSTLERVEVTVSWTTGRKQGETHLEIYRVGPSLAR